MNQAGKSTGAERRAKIIAAGQFLFLRNGLRGTTMEAIAREAGVAKPTLYAYFPDKEAVFAAVVGRLVDEMKSLVTRALAQEATNSARVSRALAAKHKHVFRLLEGSPHASELYGEKGRLAARQMDSFERWLEAQIATALMEGGQAEPQKYAQLIIACADGISGKARHVEQIGPAIRLVAESLLD